MCHIKLSSVRFSIKRYLLRPRWLIVLVVTTFFTYTSTDTVTAYGLNTSLSNNIWDAFFFTFSNQNILFFVFTTLYLLMAFDLATEGHSAPYTVPRLGSRQTWWSIKVITLAITTLVYTILVTGIVVGGASLTLPIHTNWSQFALSDPRQLSIAPEVLNHLPLILFSQTILLMLLCWFTLGVFIAALTVALNNNPLWGFVLATAASFISLGAARRGITRPLSYIFFYEHFIPSYLYFNTGWASGHLVRAVAYWCILSILSVSVGTNAALKKDFYA